jgi:hypothetical protein
MSQGRLEVLSRQHNAWDKCFCAISEDKQRLEIYVHQGDVPLTQVRGRIMDRPQMQR